MSFVARNHPQQVDRRGALADVDDRRTPPDLLAECMALAGIQRVDIGDGEWAADYDLDVAANNDNRRGWHWYTVESDGLAHPWWGDVWCNPPYSDIRPWVAKAHAEARRCRSISMLLPANRTEQRWWQELVEPYRLMEPRRLAGKPLEVYFLAGRRRFDRPGWTKPAKGDRPPFGLCLIVWSAA